MDLYKQMFYCVMFVIVVFSQYHKELQEISDLEDIVRVQIHLPLYIYQIRNLQ